MGKINVCKVKLRRTWIEALLIGYLRSTQEIKPEDDHEQLLKEHAVEMMGYLSDILIRKDGEQITISFSNPAALAFQQWWMLTPHESGSLIQVTISEIIKKIDKQAKQPKKRYA